MKNTPEDYHDIFDRAFKRMITLSGRGVICMINGLFGMDYPLDATITYNSPVIHFQERQTQELLDQKLFILLPFRLLRIRRELEKNHSKEGARALIDLYKNDIIDPINTATAQGYLSWRDRLNLLAISRRLVRHLYERYDEVREEVKLMRYQTLDLDIDEYDEKYEALEEKYNMLEEQLAEKDSQLSEKDSQLAEKNSQLSEKDQEILRLKAQLAKLQNK